MDGSGQPQGGVNIGNILAGAGLLLSGATTLIPEDSSLWPKVFVFLLGFVLFCLSVMRASKNHGSKLARWFAPGNGWTSYQVVTARPAKLSRGWRLYDRALLIAFAYPILLPSLLWIFNGTAVTLGGSAETGGLLLVAETKDILPRAGVILGLTVAMVAPLLEKWALGATSTILQKVAPMFNYAGTAAAVFITAYFAGPLVGIGMVVVVGVLSYVIVSEAGLDTAKFGAQALFGSVATAVGFTLITSHGLVLVEWVGSPGLAPILSGVLAAVFVVAAMAPLTWMLERLENSGDRATAAAYALVTASVIALVVLSTTVLLWDDVPAAIRTIFVFLGLLPIVNALCDYVSYVVTLSLLRMGHNRPTAAIVTGVTDLCLAFVLFLGSGAVIVAVMAWVNDQTGVEVIPLARLFHSVVLDSQKSLAEMEYLWVYAMLFSTIVPTLLHAALALFSLESLLPPRLRGWFHGILASDDEWDTLQGLGLLSLVTTTCLFLPVYLIYRLLAGIVTVAPEFLHYYLAWLTNIACYIGPQHCPA